MTQEDKYRIIGRLIEECQQAQRKEAFLRSKLLRAGGEMMEKGRWLNHWETERVSPSIEEIRVAILALQSNDSIADDLVELQEAMREVARLSAELGTLGIGRPKL